MANDYYAIEGILLPRNADGSYQYSPDTTITEEAAQSLLRQLQERSVTEGYAAHDHPSFTDPAIWERLQKNVRPLDSPMYMHPQVWADLNDPNPRAWRRRLPWRDRLRLRWHDLLIWAGLRDWRD